MSLSSFPTELLQHIAQEIEALESLRALSCVNQRFYAIFNPVLYQRDAWNSSSDPGSLAVAWAAEYGNVTLLKKALSYGAELSPSPSPQKKKSQVPVSGEMGSWSQFSKRDNQPDHALCKAVKKGHRNITKFLIVDQRCDIDMLNQRGFPLLSLAVLYGHVHLIKFLLGQGASSQMTEDYRRGGTRRNPVRTAVVEGFERALEVLLDSELHADSRPSVEQMQDALELALHADEEVYGNKGSIIRLLVDSGLLDGDGGLNFTFRDRHKRASKTPLLWAVEQDDIKYLERFLKAGADPNFPAHLVPWETALVRAVKVKNEDKVKLLLPNTLRVRRTLALAWSIKLWSPEDQKGRDIPRILLQNGTLPDYELGDDAFLRSGSRNTFNECTLGIEYPEQLTDAPLVLAVHSGHVDLIRLLVEYGANVNIEFHEFLPSLGAVCGSLMLATSLGHMEIAQCLRNHGAVEQDYELS